MLRAKSTLQRNQNDDAMTKSMVVGFRNNLFTEDLLGWMRENDPQQYMAALPTNIKEIWIPCDVFVRMLGHEKNRRSKLMDIMEAIPRHVTQVNLDGLIDNGDKVWFFQMKRVLEALKGAPHIRKINLSGNLLFTLNEFRRQREHKAVDIFSMLMRGVSENATSLDLSLNEPNADFESAKGLKEILKKIDEKCIGPRRRLPLREAAISDFRSKLIAQYKKKMLQIPDNIQRLDLSYNFLSKFGAKDLLEILNVLFDNKNLRYLDLTGNLLETLGPDFESKLMLKLKSLEAMGKVSPTVYLIRMLSSEAEVNSANCSDKSDSDSQSEGDKHKTTGGLYSLFHRQPESRSLHVPTVSGSGQCNDEVKTHSHASDEDSSQIDLAKAVGYRR